jgi:hypothetical protein
MNVFHTREFVTGLKQPVAHQGSVIQNSQETIGLKQKRRQNQITLGALAAGTPAKRQHLEANTSTDAALFAVVMHELAFRDKPPFQGDTRGTMLQQADCQVWTAFNERTFSVDNPPQYVGVVDKGSKPDLHGRLESSQVAVAVRGTRSTFNTSHDTIHTGDAIYWDYPTTVGNLNRKPDRPSIHGIPDDKLLAITRGLPQDYAASLNIHEILFGGRRDARMTAVATRVNALNLPSFLQPVIVYAAEAAALARGVLPGGNTVYDGADPADPDTRLSAVAQGYFPKTHARMTAVVDGISPFVGLDSVIQEAMEVIASLLHCHKIGYAMNTALAGCQLDFYSRG